MLRLTPVLTWCGALPFVVGVLWQLLGVQFSAALAGAEPLWFFISYSVVILAFMAGTLWGKANHRSFSDHTGVLLATNGWALLGWVVVLVLLYQQSLSAVLLLLLAMGFWHLYRLERRCFDDHGDYLQLRKLVTMTVIVAHALMLLLVVFAHK